MHKTCSVHCAIPVTLGASLFLKKKIGSDPVCASRSIIIVTVSKQYIPEAGALHSYSCEKNLQSYSITKMFLVLVPSFLKTA